MKNILSLVLASAILASGPATAEESGGLRYTITVTKFENHSQFPAGQFALPSTFASLLTDSLQKTGKFIVLGEKDMRLEAIAEQDFGASGRTAAGNKRPESGMMTPAQLLVKGEITNFQSSTSGSEGAISFRGISFGGGSDRAEINAVIYVIDASTGQVVASQKILGKAASTKATVKFTNQDWGADLSTFKNTNVGLAMEQAIDQGVEFITNQLAKVPWEGTVISVKEDSRLYINRGAREGVSAGQRFAIGDMEKIRDPNTGEVLDVTIHQVGAVEIEQVKEKLSIARVIAGTDQVRPGMAVMALQ